MKPLCVIALLALSACTTVDPTENQLDDWTPGVPTTGGDTGDTGTIDTANPGGLLKITPVLAYDGRFGTVADPDLDCELDTTGGYAEQSCQLEANELDLYFHGWAYNLSIPANTCDYLSIISYYYQAWSMGTGPTLVEYKVDESGQWLSDTSNSVGGAPTCEFDHSGLQNPGPNCCYGEYQVQVTVVAAGGGETVQPISPPIEWGGGAPGSCFEGAAYHSSATELTEDGFPKVLVVDIDESADSNFSVSFDSPLGLQVGSNVTVANYLEAGAAIPAGRAVGIPEYYVSCVDQAAEVRGRFAMTVREWDEEAQFDLESEGDPNSGIQSAPGAAAPEESNGSGSLINDFWDWQDFGLNSIDFVGPNGG
ncbi:MAG: hypothetical protein KC912_08830 [Proteobacteria bacterium]|nr:hypothetical protein [Pseudomonadota bacterium]